MYATLDAADFSPDSLADPDYDIFVTVRHIRNVALDALNDDIGDETAALDIVVCAEAVMDLLPAAAFATHRVPVVEDRILTTLVTAIGSAVDRIGVGDDLVTAWRVRLATALYDHCAV